MTAIATLLIEKGADPNVSTDDFRSPLGSAVDQNDESMIRQLLDAGADVNVDGGQPFLSAGRIGKTHIVKLLIDAGAEIYIQQGVSGHALQKAATWGRIDVCKLLISLGVDVNAQGGEEGYVLMFPPSRFSCLFTFPSTLIANFFKKPPSSGSR
jgi:ankyrin repeat domain-containing protein 50